jgi:hypothetical protein
MLEHVLGDDEIEGVVRIGQGLDILAGSARGDFRARSQPLVVTGTEIAVIIPQHSAEAIVRGGVIDGDIPRSGQVGNRASSCRVSPLRRGGCAMHCGRRGRSWYCVDTQGQSKRTA